MQSIYKTLFKRCFSLSAIIIFNCFFLFFTGPVYSQSISFNGSTQYGNLGNDPSLHVTDFTLEAWIKIQGAGVSTNSGTGGTTLIPIIAKGRAETEDQFKDVNYIFGYDPTTKKLTADFEETKLSRNYPVTGTTAISNCWTHIAASYKASTATWNLYVNGVLDQTLTLDSTYVPQSASLVDASIGSSLNSMGGPAGFFNGLVDEVRIWNVERTGAEIAANYNAELTSGAGLVARYGFNEGSGTIAANSVAGGPDASLVNGPTWMAGFNYNKALLDFNGTSDYVKFGAAPDLNTSTFTLEASIRIEGTGTATSTGTGGLLTVVPIVTKGRGEAETPPNLNMNYFMGLVGKKLAADFEQELDPAPGKKTGLNHPVIGNADIPMNTWTHVAATYDPSTGTWKLYINGNLDQTLVLDSTYVPEPNSIQHAAVGTAMTSTGVPAGYFNGKIDEVRIWNVVRTQPEIMANMNNELTSGTGLIGRFGFNEGCGLMTANSVSGGSNGTLSSTTGPVWVLDNFNSRPPDAPTNPSPPDNSSDVSTSPTLCTTVSDPNGDNLTVRFYGRKKSTTGTPGGNFTIIALPDTQFYTEELPGTNSMGGGNNKIFKAQTQWIADHRVDSNIVFAVQLGDCAQNGDNPPGPDPEIEFKRADTAMKLIENPNVPIMDGIPFDICVGNHDQEGNGNPDGATFNYNKYFGSSRFSTRAYYGGHYGSNNDNHYELFTAGGIDFIHISIEYYANGTTPSLQPVLDWADALLKANSNRKGILSSHNMLSSSGNFQGPGQKIYDDLKDNPNLILMLAGHVPGEGRRTDVYNGNTIQTVMADYQSGYGNGGNGYLRIMQFRPSQNMVSFKTYSPSLDASLTSSSSDFTLSMDLSDPFVLLGTNTNVTSGTSTCTTWAGIDNYTNYEWYVEVSDGQSTTTGPVWTFYTGSPLPVKLITFDAKAQSNRSVNVTWTVANEKNNDHYEIQSAANGIDFTTIGSVAGNNTSTNSQAYSYFDNDPSKGVSYYRLKQVDTDGKITYSGIRKIVLSSSDNDIILLYPNPSHAGNAIHLEILKDFSGSVEVKIFDVKGRLQFRNSYLNSRSISIEHALLPGVYTVQITGDQIKKIEKLVIQ